MNHLVQIEGKNYELQPAVSLGSCLCCAFYSDDMEDDCSWASLEAEKQVGHGCIKFNPQQTHVEQHYIFVEKRL